MATRASPSSRQLAAIREAYRERRDDLDLFRKQVVSFFESSRQLRLGHLPPVHSIKSRMKDEDHLEDKVRRKWREKQISPENLLRAVTDLAGVRVLHLHTQQFATIHMAIMAHVEGGFWVLGEKPTAYSWDPEATQYFRSLGLKAVTRESYYTSVHYVIKPHARTDLNCEVQVRTLFEEIWGEIDHSLNYPAQTKLLACKEQLRVLAKLASTGTRLADSIFRISSGEGA
jgi:putative GTP pyrophosphokinase